LTDEGVQEIYAHGADTVVAGTAVMGGGKAVPVDGGYRVTGRWAFATGCERADWLYGNCLEGVVDGVPQLRIAVFRPEDVVIEDTWTATGLCGTGSHHFRVDDLVVPAQRTVVPMADEPCLDEPVVRVPVPSMLGLAIAAVALGVAQGALDDVTALATTTTPLFAPAPLATNPLFQHDLATAVTELRAARALVHETATSVWDTAVERAPFTLARRADARAAATWATAHAAAVVGIAYRSAGAGAVYAESPLQRRFRDLHALAQHFLVKGDTLTTAGAVLAGQEPAAAVF
jgi:alkylation response protein AidB-like acyl-CoA dehydrogenase